MWRAGAELSLILLLVYVCDRTTLLPAAAKVRDARAFWALSALLLLLASLTVRQLAEGRLMAREQTDEWKGWMQLMFLMCAKWVEMSGRVKALAVERPFRSQVSLL